MSKRKLFSDQLWKILLDIILHEEGGKFERIFKERNVSKNMLKAEMWLTVTKLFNDRTGLSYNKDQIKGLYNR